ncbi:MAG: S8 family serine peptidase [Candidatus Asgardarchaeum sp.]
MIYSRFKKLLSISLVLWLIGIPLLLYVSPYQIKSFKDDNLKDIITPKKIHNYDNLVHFKYRDPNSTNSYLILKIKHGISKFLVANMLFELFSNNIKIIRIYDRLPFILIKVNTIYELEKLSNLPYIDNLYFDKSFHITWPSFDTKQFSVWANAVSTIDVPKLWEKGFLGDNITIAILDTGVDSSHPDLDDLDDNESTPDYKIIGFKDFINGRDDLNLSDGIDAYDDNGHGTAVAGIISGTGFASNGTYKGVAPHSKILAIKVVDSEGNGNISDLLSGIDFAMKRNVNVLSMSLGAPETKSDPILEAVSLAVSSGIVVVAAAGNDGPYFGTVNSPGIAPASITVAASFGNITLASWSSRGPTILTHYAKPDITAPGVNVITTRAKETLYLKPIDKDRYYTLFSGTSAATPFVSGVVALLLQAYPSSSPLKIKIALVKTAKSLGFSWVEEGAGLVNASAAFEYLSKPSSIFVQTFPENLEISYILPEVGYGPINVLIGIYENVSSITYTLTGNISQLYDYSQISYIGNGYYAINSTFNKKVTTDLIGTFIGNFTIAINGTIYVNSIIKIHINPYGGRVVWDLYHQSQMDSDSPEPIFIDAFSRLDMSVEVYNNPIDDEVLQFTDVLVINDIEQSFTSLEINKIIDWVNEGGTLIVMTGFYNETSGEAAFAFESLNELLNYFGIEIKNKSIGVGNYTLEGKSYGIGYGGYVVDSQLTKNVSSLYVVLGTALGIKDPNKAQGLVYINDEDVLVAVAYSGKGRVIALGDDNLFWDDIVYASFLRNDSNFALLKNIASFSIPNRPVIYDFAIAQANNGYLINFQTFSKVGIKQVTLAILNFDGSWDNKTLTSDNGFSYASAIPDSIFSYDVFIVITDYNESSRIIHLRLESLLSLPLLIILIAIGIMLIGVAIFMHRRREKPPPYFYYDPQYLFGPPP